MKQLLVLFGIFSLLLPGASSCSKMESEALASAPPALSLPQHIVARGTVQGVPDDFRIVLDNGDLLVVRENYDTKTPVNGQRVQINYKILSQEKFSFAIDGQNPNDKIVYYIRLYSMQELQSATTTTGS